MTALETETPSLGLIALLGRFGGYVRPHRGRFILSGIALVVILLASFGQLMVLRHLFGQMAAKREILVPLRWMIPLMVGLTLLRAGAGFAQEAAMLTIRQDVMGRLRTDMLARILAADLAYLQTRPSGWFSRRMGGTLTVLQNSFGSKLEAVLRNGGVALSAAAFLLWTDWCFSVAGFAIFAVTLLPQYRMHGKWVASNERFLELSSRVSDYSSQIFRGARRVQAHRREAYEIDCVRQHIQAADVEDRRKTLVRAMSGLLSESVGAVALWVPLLIVGLEIEAGYRGAATLPSLVSGLLALRYALRSLVGLPVDLQAALTALRQIVDTLDLPSAIADAPDAVPLEVGAGALSCQGLYFRYDARRMVLRNVDLAVPPRAMVALVGTSGSGKSTLLGLLMRFYDPVEGGIAINGCDLRTVTLSSLRGAIALVGQDDRLFDETVHANIAYGRPDATRDEVIEAARMAQAHEFIDELPEGYDTVLGEQGRALSSGQQQRVALARGILMEAPIMLMDEPTSALDSETERRVLTAMAPFLAERTCIVVAHRLSTIMAADLIYVMDRGRIVEHGTHAALIRQGGAYARMWRKQSDSEAA